jgi:hypothetical protein
MRWAAFHSDEARCKFLFQDGKDAIGSAIGQRNSRANTTGLAWADRAIAAEFGRIAFFGVEAT